MLIQELLPALTCHLTEKASDEQKMDQAEKHLHHIIQLTQSKRKFEDYSIKIVVNVAHFKLKVK